MAATTNGHRFTRPAPALAREATGELLRFATAGSVDDGKSTLIGRLLFDTKAIFEDTLDQVTLASERRHGASGQVDLALLTDGLRAEREQGITIDVAYRYFTTPRRSFIIADTPGHVRYTRNMVTGASTADLALVLVDARQGVVEQSRRHAFIASMLRIPHIVVCVNKMDLVDYGREAFASVVDQFSDFAEGLDVPDVTFVPISALHGDNVVTRSAEMDWYDGPALLDHLETVRIATDRNLDDVRFPVQWVIRPGTDEHHDYRGYAGQLAGGILRPGDDVVVLPSMDRSRVAAIDTFDGPVDEAFPPMSVTVRLEDDLDVSRGDVIVRPQDMPHLGKRIEAMVCWMSERPAVLGGRYIVRHLTSEARAVIEDVAHRVDVTTLERDGDATGLALNDIGRVTLSLASPWAFDPYSRNRLTGSFIVIDEATNDTVAAGMIVGAPADHGTGGDVLSRAERWQRLGVRGATVWLSGAPEEAAGLLEARLVDGGVLARHAPDGEAAAVLADAGVVAIVAGEGADDGDTARALHAAAGLELLEATTAERAWALLAERGIVADA